jgi:hypothetical protein
MGVDGAVRPVRGAARAAAKRVYRGLVGERPDDPVRAWRGTALAHGPALCVLHVGDCGVRRMDAAHDLLAPPGYPLAAARRLRREGILLEFSHYFCVSFENLPEIEELRGHVHLSADPEFVLVQIGSAYTRKIILPDTTRIHQLRDELGRRAGGLVHPFYRVLRPWLRLVGRHSAGYRGTEQLERFVQALHAAWPSAQVLLVVPFRRSPGYASGEPVAARLEADLNALAATRYVSVFDANDVLGRDPALRCVTGYNLNGRGSELVGAELASWIRSSPLVAASEEREGAPPTSLAPRPAAPPLPAT